MKIPGVRKLTKPVLIALLIVVLGLTTQGLLSTTPCVSGQTVPRGWAEFERILEYWATQQEVEADGVASASPENLSWQPWFVPLPAEPAPPLPTPSPPVSVGGIATLPDIAIQTGQCS